MPTVLKCPQCEALVRVPNGVGVNSLVCCPACSEEFLLGEFQDSGLPELVVLKSVPDPEAAESEIESEIESESESESESKIESQTVIESPTQSDRENVFDFAAAADEAEETPVAVWGQDESPSEDSEIDTEADSVEEIPIPTDEASEDFDFQGKVRRRKEANIGAFLLMNILGGAFGLLVAYYALCWIGFAGGLPKLPLPLLPHTMHWNEAVVDWVRGLTDGSAEDQNADVNAAKGSLEDMKDEGHPEAPTPPPQRKRRTLAKGAVGPKEPTEYFAIAELDTQLKEAEAALVKDGGFSRASYRKFCRLGELLPFTEASAELPQRTEQIRTMLKHYGAGEKNENAIARLASIVLSHPDWPEPGILVAGEVRETSQKNGLHEMLVWLPFYKKVMPILSGGDINLKKGLTVLVLGRVIKKPSENIAGYRGEYPRVIWKGLIVACPTD